MHEIKFINLVLNIGNKFIYINYSFNKIFIINLINRRL